MASASSSLLSLALVLLLCSTTTHALDVLKVLSNPKYALFSKALTEANLVDKINALNAVTVLPLSNAAMASLAGKSPEFVKATISTHVLVGYYDEVKLVETSGPQTPIETLFQSSGLAKGNQGYVQVQVINEGDVAVGSAAESIGTIFDVVLVLAVANQPEVLSVLEVNKPIVVPGIENLFSNVKLPTAALNAKNAVPPSALAPAPTSDASRLCMGLLAAASASAAFILAL